MEHSDPMREFARYMERPDEDLRLDQAALLLARTEYPRLDMAEQLTRLDRLAAPVEGDPCRTPLENIEQLNQRLFEEENFSGNEEEYDDPRNSYLNDVLDRKKGIPITLSLVYTEVARRRSLPIVGVGFPGHFLIKYLAGSHEILLDPYNRGIRVTPEDCEARLKAQFGQEAELRQEYLAASTTRQTLTRMLNNLKGSYFRRRNFPRVLSMIELGLAVDPGSRQEIHDRGTAYFLMGRYRDALADFKGYLALAPPGDPRAKDVNRLIGRIRAMTN